MWVVRTVVAWVNLVTSDDRTMQFQNDILKLHAACGASCESYNIGCNTESRLFSKTQAHSSIAQVS